MLHIHINHFVLLTLSSNTTYNLMFSIIVLLAPPSPAHSQPPPSWSPWEPSPLFLQQRLSLTSQAPSYLQLVTNNAKITFQPTPHPSMKRIKSENASSSLSERSPAKAKSRIHNSVKSLIHRPLVEKDDFKYFSNSLNCLDVAKL